MKMSFARYDSAAPKRVSGLRRAWMAGVALVAMCLASVAPVAQAQQSPTQVIQQSVDSLMSELEGKKDYYAQHEGELAKLVDTNMAEVADFRYIGASVMGRYFRGATCSARR